MALPFITLSVDFGGGFARRPRRPGLRSQLNTVIAQNAQLHQANLVSHTAQSSPAYQQVPRQVTEHFVAQGSTMLQAKQQAIGWIGQLIARQASLIAYVDVFRYCAIVTALFVSLALLLRSPKFDKR